LLPSRLVELEIRGIMGAAQRERSPIGSAAERVSRPTHQAQRSKALFDRERA
jgi:hypothetical protein